MFIGATTAIFAATIGLVQNDIKRIVAYSTCSQLGYMFVAYGGGRLFGRHVFICSRTPSSRRCCSWARASVIYAMHHEQDIRKHGRPEGQDPFTYIVMVIGTAGADRFPAHRRLFLQGRHHRIRVRLA